MARSVIWIIKSPALINNTRSSSPDEILETQTTLTRALLSCYLFNLWKLTHCLVCLSHLLNYRRFTLWRLLLWFRAALCIKAPMFQTDRATRILLKLTPHLTRAQRGENSQLRLFLSFNLVCFSYLLTLSGSSAVSHAGINKAIRNNDNDNKKKNLLHHSIQL